MGLFPYGLGLLLFETSFELFCFVVYGVFRDLRSGELPGLIIILFLLELSVAVSI